MFGFTVIRNASVASSGLTEAMIQAVEAVIQASLEYWGRYIEAPNANIEIDLSFESLGTNVLAEAGPQFASTGGGPFLDVVNGELSTNTDSGPFDFDASMTINIDRINDGSFFFDTTYEPNPMGIGPGQSDLLTVMTHEIGHILGFVGNFPPVTTLFSENTEEIGGNYYFTGANAVAANGGQNILVDSWIYGATGHISGVGDLLSATLITGNRLPINPVHIGILEDLGLNIVTESTGADILHGFEEFDDIIDGLTGDDALFGYSGNDTLIGSDGNDILNGGLGNDVLNGGNGIDQASYSDSDVAVSVNLLTGATSGGHADGDQLSSIENLFGSTFGDMLTGDAGVNVLTGYSGNDNLQGLAGNDTLDGGDGTDIVDGGNGEDVIDGGSGDDTLRGGGDNDTIDGGVGADSISAGIGDDTVHGGDGDDSILGQGDADTLYGDGGADTLRGGSGNDTLFGGDDNDILFGQGNNDILYGEAGNDNLSGAAGSDQLFGGDGNDILNGSIGADRLDGGAGNDTLNGGGDDGARDTFVFAVGYDEDRINAFDQAGTDRLELDDALWAGAGTLTGQEVVDMFGSLNAAGTILTLDFGNGDILEIQNGAGIDIDTFGLDIMIV